MAFKIVSQGSKKLIFPTGLKDIKTHWGMRMYPDAGYLEKYISLDKLCYKSLFTNLFKEPSYFPRLHIHTQAKESSYLGTREPLCLHSATSCDCVCGVRDMMRSRTDTPSRLISSGAAIDARWGKLVTQDNQQLICRGHPREEKSIAG